MPDRIIKTDDAPKPIGPYSQAVEAGGFLFLAGQVSINPATSEVEEGTVTEQTERIFTNLKAVLGAAGMSLSNVVKTTVFLRDMDDFAEMNAVYGAHFTDSPPARSCVAVAGLPKNLAVEIELIAH